MLKGAEYVCLGIAEFFRDPKIWKYSLVPLAITLIAYGILGGLCWYMVSDVSAYFNEVCNSWPGFLQWIPKLMSYTVGALVIMVFMLVIIFTAGTLYELFGGPFFDHMIENYEHKNYGTMQNKNRWDFEVQALIDSSLYSFISLLILLGLLILGLFLPFIGTFISFVIMSYRFGVLYLAICNFRHGVNLDTTSYWTRRNIGLTLGFGMLVQLIFWVPLLPLLLLPGIIIGGVLLLKDRFQLLPSGNSNMQIAGAPGVNPDPNRVLPAAPNGVMIVNTPGVQKNQDGDLTNDHPEMQ